MHVAVIGAGSWGTGLASLIADRNEVCLWSRRDDLATSINVGRENSDYLPGYRLPDALRATSSIAEALGGAELVMFAVPSHGMRHVVEQGAGLIAGEVPILSLAKGLESTTLMRMTEIINGVLPGHQQERVGVLTGPNLVRELIAGQPGASVIAMADAECATRVQCDLMNDTLRIYTNPDVVGCEVAGVTKNIIAIAVGMADGMGYGDNTKAALMTRGLAEVTRMGVALGGDPSTFIGLAGVGDLVATCVSETSRNRRVGIELGRGRTLEAIVRDTRMVAEGVRSAESVLELARSAGVEVPIAEQVASVLHGRSRPADLVAALMGREAKSERQ